MSCFDRTLLLRLRKSAILVLVLLAFTGASQAQLSGAELRYNYSAGEKLHIELVAFYPCGFEQVPTFQYATVTETMVKGSKKYVKLLPKADRKLDNNVASPCKNASACIKEVTFIGEVDVNNVPGGYDILWRHCCIDGLIENLEANPEEGFMLQAHVSETALKQGNHSAVIVNAPFIKACPAMESNSLCHAVDTLDRDSVVVRFVGLTSDRSTSEPAENNMVGPENTLHIPSGPFNVKSYAANFSGEQPLGAESTIKVDNGTRELKLTANQKGRFVLSLAIDEYRNSKLIGTTYRVFFTDIN